MYRYWLLYMIYVEMKVSMLTFEIITWMLPNMNEYELADMKPRKLHRSFHNFTCTCHV